MRGVRSALQRDVLFQQSRKLSLSRQFMSRSFSISPGLMYTQPSICYLRRILSFDATYIIFAPLICPE